MQVSLLSLSDFQTPRVESSKTWSSSERVLRLAADALAARKLQANHTILGTLVSLFWHKLRLSWQP